MAPCAQIETNLLRQSDASSANEKVALIEETVDGCVRLCDDKLR
jgi:hypothetical protein